jgi:hypothetical protein
MVADSPLSHEPSTEYLRCPIVAAHVEAQHGPSIVSCRIGSMSARGMRAAIAGRNFGAGRQGWKMFAGR